jgi:23S rRNA pseudouridine1911/1915/1917 synthase
MQRGKHAAERFRVEQATTVEAVLHEHMPGASRRTLKQLVEHGRVSVGGAPARRLDAAVAAGSVVEVSPRGPKLEPDRPMPFGLVVLFEDETVVVVEKPAGLLTIATERERTRTAYAAVRAHVKARDPRERVFIVHRLDRSTSGVIVFAKSPDAKERLQSAFAARSVERTYHAVVEGVLEADEGTLKSYLVESSAHKVHATRDARRGVEAITRYRVLRRGRSRTLVEVGLVTGRKAQIRVQFADIGHPVVGDRVYGKGTDPIGRVALHAFRIAFDHPETGQRMTFRSRTPQLFSQLVSEE